jgi:hypothetical protein
MNVELKKLRFSIGIALAVILLAVVVLVWFLTRSFINIKVTPADAIVLVDGKEVKISAAGNGKASLSLGTHLFKIEADGFIGLSQNIEIKRGLSKQLVFELAEMAKPEKIGEDGALLFKGNEFNDGYYLGNSGRTIYRTKITAGDDKKVSITENRAITEARLSNIKEIIWSPTKELALFRKNNGEISLFDFMKYDFVHQTETAWGKDIGAIAWAPDNSKIAYYYTPASGERSLIFADLKNTAQTRVANLKDDYEIENPILRWSPDSEGLILIPQSADIAKNKVYYFSIFSRTIKPLTEDGGYLDAVFSPDSNKILYSKYQKSPETTESSTLLLMEKDGNNKSSLNLMAEIGKVTWSKDSRHLIVAAFDRTSGGDILYRYDTNSKSQAGFLLNNLGKIYIDRVILLDSDKIVLYETGGSIYALMVE